MSEMEAKRPGRAELVLFALLLAALVLRAWNALAHGIDHYDEGVYAFSAIGIADPSAPLQLFPGEFRFSPPVFFSLIGAVARVFGLQTDAAAIALNVALGTLTVAALWWIGRAWFGATAGLAAAALLGFNEYHVTLSRTGLTDVTFALFFLIAVYALIEALERRSLKLALLAGLAVGVAWNTKYHGWLALALAGASLIPALWETLRGRSRDGLRLLGLWGVSALVAAACYVPWALYVEGQPGGYRGLMEYQKTMLQGAWIDNLLRQGLHQLYFEGAFSRAGAVIALLAAVFALRARYPLSRSLAATIGFIGVSALTVGIAGTACILSVLALPRLLGKERNLRTTVLVVWMLVWFILTPLYHPYARLVLPFTIAACLAGGAWIAGRIERLSTQTGSGQGALVTALVALVVGSASLFILDPSHPWRSGQSQKLAATSLEEKIPAGSRVIVLGEPSLGYYLHISGRPAFENISGRELGAALEAAREPVYVVTGIYAARTKATAENAARFGDKFVLLGSVPFDPSDIRLLDDFAPRRALKFREQPTREYDLQLYRYTP